MEHSTLRDHMAHRAQGMSAKSALAYARHKAHQRQNNPVSWEPCRGSGSEHRGCVNHATWEEGPYTFVARCIDDNEMADLSHLGEFVDARHADRREDMKVSRDEWFRGQQSMREVATYLHDVCHYGKAQAWETAVRQAKEDARMLRRFHEGDAWVYGIEALIFRTADMDTEQEPDEWEEDDALFGDSLWGIEVDSAGSGYLREVAWEMAGGLISQAQEVDAAIAYAHAIMEDYRAA